MRHMARVTKLDVFPTLHRVASTSTEVSTRPAVDQTNRLNSATPAVLRRLRLFAGRYGNQNMANYPQVFNFSYNEDVRLAPHDLCEPVTLSCSMMLDMHAI